MGSLELPEVVFSKPAGYNWPSNGLGSVSSNGYWSSNGSGSSYGVQLNQQPLLDATTSGGRDDLLTPDTSRFMHGDSKAFNALTKSTWPDRFSGWDGWVIYTFRVRQDSPIILPTFAPAQQAEIRLKVSVTARSVVPHHPIVDLRLDYGPINQYGIHDRSMQEPSDLVLGPEWKTFVSNMTYDSTGYDSFKIVDGVMPSFWKELADTAARGEMSIGMTFGAGNQDFYSMGTVDIAHVKFGATISWVGTQIDPGDLNTRQHFGRA